MVVILSIFLFPLHRVVHSVPALTSNFWEVVARRLGTGHTAHQCSTAYHGQQNKMKPPSSRPRKRGKDKLASQTTVTAKTGTLKRKRQLRDALENLDSGYVDDIFDSTPFKKIKKSVQVSINFSPPDKLITLMPLPADPRNT